MNCETVRNELVDYLDGRSGPIKRLRVRRHIDRCEACAEALREDEGLNERLAALEDRTPPEAIWLRIRETVSAAGLSETILPTWWERIRIVTLRHAVPYALGVATTVLLIMSGLGRHETSVAPVGEPDASGVSGVMARDSAPIDGEWSRTPVGPGSVRPGEASLVVEDTREAILRLRQQDYREALEAQRRNGMKDEDLEVAPVTPVSFGEKTH